MNRLLTALVVAVLGCATFTFGAVAQEKANSNRLNLPELKKMVDGMGYETKMNGEKSFEFRVRVDNLTAYVAMNLSPDGSNIWFESDLVPIKEPEKAPAKAWFDLMSENNKIGPSHFAYCQTAKCLFLYRPMPNQDMTPARIREQLDLFTRTIRDTSRLWDRTNFQQTAAVAAK